METFTRSQPHQPWTADRLLKIIESMPPMPPDPLKGSDTLYVHPDRREDAEKINEAAGGRLHIILNIHMPKHTIAGFQFGECVVFISTEKQ